MSMLVKIVDSRLEYSNKTRASVVGETGICLPWKLGLTAKNF